MSKNRQQQVVMNYKSNGGNMKKAMIDAGYSESYADRNSKYLLGIIGEEIKTQQNEIKSEGIKTATEIQEWWSGIMDDSNEDMKNRIKCSELLARAQGAFVEKVVADVNINTSDKIKEVENYIKGKRTDE